MSNTGLFVTASLIWGSTWLAITYQLGQVAPEISVVYRFTLAAGLLAIGCLVAGRSLRFRLREHAGIAAQGALLFGLNYVAIYWAEQHIASGLVAVLFSTIVFMSMIASRAFFATPLTVRGLSGAALGVCGVTLLFLPELGAAQYGSEAARGVAFALGSAVLSCLGNMVVVRNQRAGIPILASSAWGMAYGAAVAAVVAVGRGLPWTFDARPAYVASLVYLALFGSIAAFGAHLTLVRRVGAGPASYTGVATPVVAMLLSTLFEDYRWTAASAAGVLLAIAGNALVRERPVRTGSPRD